MIEKYLKYIPLALFALFSGKLMFLGVSLEQALICAVLGAVSSFFCFKSNDKQLEEVKTKLNEMTKAQEDNTKQIQEMKDFIGGLKMSQGMRTLGQPGSRF